MKPPLGRQQTDRLISPEVRRQLRLAAAAQVLAALLWPGQAACLAAAVMTLSEGGGVDAIAEFALGIVLLAVVRSLLDDWGSRQAFLAARKALGQARTHGLAALIRQPVFGPGRIPSGTAAVLVAEQAEALVPYLQRYLPVRWRVAVVPLGLLLLAGSVSWVAALILLTAAPLIPLFMALIGMKAREASERQLDEIGSMNGVLMDRLRGLKTLKLVNAIEFSAAALREAGEGVRARTMAVLRIAFLSSAVLELFSALGVALVAVYVGFHLLGDLGFGAWGGRMSLGEGLFVLLLAPAFFEPLRDLAAVWHDRAAGEAALSALAGLTAESPTQGAEIPDVSGGEALLILTDADIGHPGQPPILTNVSLTLAPGERVALWAPSGSGKSSLLATIAGLIPLRRGMVQVAGGRRSIAWVGHRPAMVEGSVTANVTLGRPGVEASSALALLLPEVDPLRRVGEGGYGLSGGEALRLAVARAIADPAARLILADEPTAHLDAGTAEQVTGALLAAAEGRALLVATHDPRLAARMDRIIRLVP